MKTARVARRLSVIADMTGVTFIDSSGLGVMVAWFKMCNQSQGKLAFCGLNSHVSRIVGYAKLDKIFTIVDTLEEAEAMM